ncbi:MAG: hypothetical protein IMF19_04390 [Proteobacteria bacterium]|nr:hypothetical protein [Pseudomonadota bacterium]
MKDNYVDRAKNALCGNCIYYVSKGANNLLGRCRRNAPVTVKGYPVVFPTDWCGEHKLDETKMIERAE